MIKRLAQGRWWPALLVAAFMLCGLAIYRGTANLDEKQSELRQVQETNQRLVEQNEILLRGVQRLRSDSQAIERACRKEMGMIRPDEVLYQEPAGR